MRGGNIRSEHDGVVRIERQQIIQPFGIATQSPIAYQLLEVGGGGHWSSWGSDGQLTRQRGAGFTNNEVSCGRFWKIVVVVVMMNVLLLNQRARRKWGLGYRSFAPDESRSAVAAKPVQCGIYRPAFRTLLA